MKVHRSVGLGDRLPIMSQCYWRVNKN